MITTERVGISEFWVRWTFKPEMKRPLRAAGFTKYGNCGGFDRRPLTQESDLLIVLARADG